VSKTKATKPTRMLVDQPEQLAALTSPVRLELLELFGIWGPCAVANVAQQMGRAPDSLYYHVRKLAKVGLLEEVGRQRKAHRFEAIYRLPAEELELPRKASTPGARRSTNKAIDAVLRLAGRELKLALDDDALLDEGPQRTFYGRRLKGRLSKTRIRELNKHLSAIETIYAEAAVKSSRHTQSIATTIVMTPVQVREGT
jgi:transposase-like protein